LFPDLILLDLRMPRASGWDFLENVRSTPRWNTIPVVIVSAHLEEGPDLAGDSGLNIVGQLAKPVSVGDLLAKVEEIIGPAQAHASRSAQCFSAARASFSFFVSATTFSASIAGSSS